MSALNGVEEPSEMHPIGGEEVDDSEEKDKIGNRAKEISVKYDSKSATGFVGIVKEKDEKAYINSLLQMLFHIPYLRKLVRNIPETVKDTSTLSTIKQLFYNLEISDISVSKVALLSFSDASLEDEVRTLCKEFEDKMKGMVEEGAMRKLFEGQYNKNGNVRDTFFGLDLEVKNCKDVYASLNKYIDDKQSGAFTAFPPVLQLRLVRSCGDDKNTLEVNDGYEYPYQLDLDREDGKYLSNDADKNIRNLYTLHSVLGHNTSDNYFAIITPKLSKTWFKFEDEQVTLLAMQRNMEEQNGGEEEFPPFKFTDGSIAPMLIYCRKKGRDMLRCIDGKEINEKLRTNEMKPSDICGLCSGVGSAVIDVEDFGVISAPKAPPNPKVTKISTRQS
ncbi:unnamed protein product [Arabis nemorensis]|uniref:USP domain-containing protein n=1 Tax=Arabis nemorensis TaxID=586526 RepID=A0A565BH05_9BRAS|nr:unnamed protein product [Arabis nemorensis]